VKTKAKISLEEKKNPFLPPISQDTKANDLKMPCTSRHFQVQFKASPGRRRASRRGRTERKDSEQGGEEGRRGGGEEGRGSDGVLGDQTSLKNSSSAGSRQPNIGLGDPKDSSGVTWGKDDLPVDARDLDDATLGKW